MAARTFALTHRRLTGQVDEWQSTRWLCAQHSLVSLRLVDTQLGIRSMHSAQLDTQPMRESFGRPCASPQKGLLCLAKGNGRRILGRLRIGCIASRTRNAEHPSRVPNAIYDPCSTYFRTRKIFSTFSQTFEAAVQTLTALNHSPN